MAKGTTYADYDNMSEESHSKRNKFKRPKSGYGIRTPSRLDDMNSKMIDSDLDLNSRSSCLLSPQCNRPRPGLGHGPDPSLNPGQGFDPESNFDSRISLQPYGCCCSSPSQLAPARVGKSSLSLTGQISAPHPHSLQVLEGGSFQTSLDTNKSTRCISPASARLGGYTQLRRVTLPLSLSQHQYQSQHAPSFAVISDHSSPAQPSSPSALTNPIPSQATLPQSHLLTRAIAAPPLETSAIAATTVSVALFPEHINPPDPSFCKYAVLPGIRSARGNRASLFEEQKPDESLDDLVSVSFFASSERKETLVQIPESHEKGERAKQPLTAIAAKKELFTKCKQTMETDPKEDCQKVAINAPTHQVDLIILAFRMPNGQRIELACRREETLSSVLRRLFSMDSSVSTSQMIGPTSIVSSMESDDRNSSVTDTNSVAYSAIINKNGEGPEADTVLLQQYICLVSASSLSCPKAPDTSTRDSKSKGSELQGTTAYGLVAINDVELSLAELCIQDRSLLLLKTKEAD